jgi:putative endonuclease
MDNGKSLGEKCLTTTPIPIRFAHGDKVPIVISKTVKDIEKTGADLKMRDYWVYIMANKSRMLCVGVTNDLMHRVFEHKNGLLPGFTKRYHMTRLVYCEQTNDVTAAIAREKELKGWVRRKKVALIHSANPNWEDLSEGWDLIEADRSRPHTDINSLRSR